MSASAGRILIVCTANICRSPTTEALLAAALGARGAAGVVLASAGTAAPRGAPMCRTASGLAATRLPAAARAGLAGHRSTPVDLAGIRQADLVLALDRSHRTALVRGAPGARPRVFTLREAAALAEPVARQLQAGGLPAGAPPLPAPPDRLGRLRWWVAELEARRHLEAQQGPPPVPADQDVPDPHVVGAQYHPRAFDFIESSVGVLADSLTSALDFVSSNAGFTLDEA